MQATPLGKTDRWAILLIVTLGINLVSAVLWPMLVTDAFTWEVFTTSVTPVIWGFALLFVYRTKRERYITWIAAVAAILWLIPTIGMPIQFGGR